MIDKREFLVGTACLLAARDRPAAASGEATGADLVLQHEPALVLGSGGPVAEALRLAGRDGAILRMPRPGTGPLTLRNDTSVPAGFEALGSRGVGADPQWRDIGPGIARVLTLTARDPGTALIRAAPSPDHQAQRGAVAALVVAEAEPMPVDHDRTLLLQDWLVGADGRLRFGAAAAADAVAWPLTVNGQAKPEVLTVAPRARLRLRLLNASTRRAMLVGCEGGAVSVIAVDGQPASLFAPARNTVPIGPGARFDLVLDVPPTAGQQARVLLRGTEPVAGAREPDQTLLLVRSEGPPRDAWPPLAPLPINPALPRAIPLEDAKRLDLAFALDGAGPAATWSVNGSRGADKPALAVRQGDAVVLGFRNASAVLVSVRVRGQAMRVLHAQDDGWDPYWRDSVLVPPRGTVYVAFVADVPGLWPIESAFDEQLINGLRSSVSVAPR